MTVVKVDPVIKCYGPEGWPDIKALNDAIYYVPVSATVWVLYCSPPKRVLRKVVTLYCCQDRSLHEPLTKFRSLSILSTANISPWPTLRGNGEMVLIELNVS